MTDSTILTLDCGTSYTQGKEHSVHVSMAKNDIQHPVSSGDKLLSPSLQKRQFCSLAMAGEVKKEDSFLGFQSVFSFL